MQNLEPMVMRSQGEIPHVDYLKMIWDEFFVSRNRGIALSKHFPWIFEPAKDFFVITVNIGKKCVGGLVLKDSTENIQCKKVKVLSLGLVCIIPEYRGRGLSSLLLNSAVDLAINNKYQAITLWTSKHRVYESAGFKLADNGLYGCVKRIIRRQAGNTDVKSCCSYQPLPPFANECIELFTNDARVYMISDGNGPILAKHEGVITGVIDIVQCMFPDSWRMNTLVDSPLIPAMQGEYEMSFRQTDLQMWLSLDNDYSPQGLNCLSQYSVLDRI